MLFCTGGMGEVAVSCLSALSSETMEAPVQRKQGRVHMQQLAHHCVVIVAEAAAALVSDTLKQKTRLSGDTVLEWCNG